MVMTKLPFVFSPPHLCGIAVQVMSNIEKNAPDTDATSATPAVPAEEKRDLATAARKSAGKAAWTGAAVGIGSAAIVAALLYTRKR
jgi:hypothetical protein